MKDGAVTFKTGNQKVFKKPELKIKKSMQIFKPIYKREKMDMNSEHLEILKIDNERRLVYGVFLYPDEADHDGDVISQDDIEKVAHGFMSDYRAIDEMHGKDAINADIVESCIAWDDIDFQGKKIKKGTWFGAVKVYDDKVWDKVKSGDYKGFSVRISGVREPIE